MANEVENRVVEMRFDNKQFEAGVQQSLTTIEKLKQSLKFEKTGEGLDKLGKKTQSFSLDHIDRSLGIISKRFTTLGIIGTTVLQNLTNSAMQMGRRLVSSVTDPLIHGGIQRAMDIAQAKFMIEGLKQPWDELSKSISAAVKGTAYGFDEAAKAAASLSASGVSAGDTMTNVLLGIAGTAAMTGSNFADIADIFTTVAGQGKLMAYQMNQLSFRGLNAAAILAEQFHKTESEIREMVSKGQISFDMFSDAMFKAFGEHAKEANQTFTGSLANMKAALKRIGQDVAAPSLDHFRDVFNALQPAIEKVHEELGTSETGFLGDLSKGIGFVSKKLVDFIGKLDFSWISGAADTVENVFLGALGIVLRLRDAFVKLVPSDLFKKLSNIGTTIHSWSKSFKDTFAYKGTKTIEKSLDNVAKKAEAVKKPLYDLSKLAKAVINGDYGNGEKRVNELHKIGASYAKVQNRVNKLLGVEKRHKETAEDLAAEERQQGTIREKLAKTTGEVSNETIKLSSAGQKTATTYDKLANIVGGMVSAVKIMGSAVSAVYKVILKPAIKVTLSAILDIGSKIGEKLIDISKHVDNTKFFEKSLKSIKSSVSNIAGKASSLAKSMANFGPAKTAFTAISNAIAKVYKGITSLPSKFVAFGNKVKDLPGVVKLADSLSRLGASLKGFLLSGFEKLTGLFGKLGGIKFNSFDSSGALSVLNFAADKLADIINLLMSGAGYAKNFLGSFGKGASSSVNGLSSSLGNLSKKVKTVKSDSDNISSSISEMFSRIAKNSKGVLKNAKTIGDNLARGLVEGFKGVNLEKVLNWAKLSAQIYLIFNLIDLVKSLKGGVDSVKGIPDKISGVFSSLSSAITQYEKSINVNVIETMASAILKISGAMLILSGIPTDQLTSITVDIGVIILALSALLKAANSVSSDTKELANIGDSIKAFLTKFIGAFKKAATLVGIAALFVGLAAGVAILGKVFLELANMQTGIISALKSVGLISLFMVELGAAVVGVSILVNKFGTALSIGTAASFLGLALSIKILADVAESLKKFDKGEILKGIGGITALMLGLAVVTRASAKGNSLITASLGMTVMAAALLLLVPALIALTKVKWGSIGKFAAVIATLSAAMAFTAGLDVGAKNILIMASALGILAVSMRIFEPAAKSTGDALKLLLGTFVFMAAGAVVAQALQTGLMTLSASLIAIAGSFAIFGAGALMFGSGVALMGKGLSFIGQGLKDLANGLVESLKTMSANRKAVVQGISDTIAGMSEGFHNAKPSFIQAVADFLTGFAVGLTQATPDLLDAISQAAISLCASIVSSIGTLVNIASAAIVLAINELANAIVTNSDPFMNAVKNVVLAIEYFCVSALKNLLSPILNAMGPIGKAIENEFNKTQEAIKKEMTYESGKELADRVMKGTKDGIVEGNAQIVPEAEKTFDEIKKAADEKANELANGNIPGMVKDPLAKEFDSANDVITEKGKGIMTNIFSTMSKDEIKSYFDGMGLNIPDGLIEGLQNGSLSLNDAITQMTTGMIDTASSNLEINSPSKVFMRIGQGVIEGLAKGLAKYDMVLKPIAELANKLSGSMKGKGSGFAAAGNQMMNGLISAIKSKAPKATSEIKKIVSSGSKAITSKVSAFKAAGKSLITNMASGMSSVASKVKSAVTNALSKAKSAASGYSSKFHSIGSDMMSGLRSGIVSKASSIASSAASVVSKAISAAKEKAKINSPSKEFMWIGEGFGEGLIKGIGNMASRVASKSSDMAGNAIDTAKGTFATLAGILDNDLNPVIRPSVDMSNVYATSKDIDALFGSRSFGLAGNINAIGSMMSNRQTGSDNSDIISAINKLRSGIDNMPRNNYNFGNVTYGDDSAISDAVGALVRAIRIDGRM